MINYVLNDPVFGYLVGITVFACFVYFILAGIFESMERQQVIEAAKKWAERKNRRNLRAENAKLWDSVNALKRGHQQQGLDDKVPAYKRNRKII